MTTFSDLDLHPQVLRAVTDLGYEQPTPIQTQAIPHLTKGRDVLGIAQTGTGKTAAFALPTLTKLANAPKRLSPTATRVLILAPTRELALQIAESTTGFAKHLKCRVETVFGGVKIGKQIAAMRKGCDVLVATPGRLVDLIERNAIRLDEVETLILDEADHMLDLGFIRDLRKIMAEVPAKRQSLLFSATMPKEIEELANGYLNDPVRVSVTPPSTTAERISQGVHHVDPSNKPALLEAVLQTTDYDRVLVFTRTKHGADKVVKKLEAGGIHAQAIHGNKNQNQRVRTLDAFRAGQCRVLIATDIAARGIDVDGISHVVNYEMPTVPEQYVHRIGRTARAGREGIAISLVSAEELYDLRQVEKTTGVAVEVLTAPEGSENLVQAAPDPALRVPKPKRPGNGGGGGQRRQNQQPRAARPARSSGPANANANTKPAKPRRRRPRKAGAAAG